MTKYSISEDHQWPDEKKREAEERGLSSTTVESHEVDIIHTTDPSEDMGYGRDKYTVHIANDGLDDDDTPYAVYATKHRWKGNFWRDVLDIDWCDLPTTVQRRVASVVACDDLDDLDPGVRVIGEDGRSTWRERGRDDDE